MKQMTPQKAIDKLTALCPCEVRYVDVDSEECWTKTAFHGCFIREYNGPYWIEISNSKSEEEQLSTLAHEVGHAMCEQENCRCMLRGSIDCNSTQLSEFHACLFQLRWLLGNQYLQALELGIDTIMRCAANYFDDNYKDAHSSSAMRIMETKLWQNCLAACDIEQVHKSVTTAVPELILT